MEECSKTFSVIRIGSLKALTHSLNGHKKVFFFSITLFVLFCFAFEKRIIKEGTILKTNNNNKKNVEKTNFSTNFIRLESKTFSS